MYTDTIWPYRLASPTSDYKQKIKVFGNQENETIVFSSQQRQKLLKGLCYLIQDTFEIA